MARRSDQTKAAITEHDYKEFYQTLGGMFDDPALTMHWHVEGRQEYTVLAFVPGSQPFDLFDPARPAGEALCPACVDHG